MIGVDLTGKTTEGEQYSWPPNWDKFFCKKEKYCFSMKSSCYKEVNRTDSSPLVRLPWQSYPKVGDDLPRNSYWRERLNTVDLLIDMFFCKTEKYCFSMKNSWSELVSTIRSIVLIIPFSKASLAKLPKGWGLFAMELLLKERLNTVGMKNSWSELVSKRRSIVLIHPLH
jgi:hypothetical protein